MTTTKSNITAPPTDPRTAQTVATHLVADALASYGGAVIHGGEAYEVAGRVVAHPRPGQLDGLVTFHISDGTREHAIAVTLQVAATPLGGA